MTQAAEINKGDKFWCIHRRLSPAMLGTVIVMTNEPGKFIGIEFETDVGGHSCDGRGKNGYCLWVHPDNILTPEEYESQETSKRSASKYQELDKFVLKNMQ